MNRQEKNQQTRAKIMQSALQEYAAHGYEGGSLNTICQNGGVSKGIIYHYFSSKDALYLQCVEECFVRLLSYLEKELDAESLTQKEMMERYFSVRSHFFGEFPLYSRLFAEALIMPPQALKAEIDRIKAPFEAFNRQYLTAMLKDMPLREDLSTEEIIDSLHLFQEYLNVRFQPLENGGIDLSAHERQCRNALEIFLYGIVRRE